MMISPLRFSTTCRPLPSFPPRCRRANLAITPPSCELDVALLDRARRGPADVEGPHRQLRAGLADRLGGDDADGHPFSTSGHARGPCRSSLRADAEGGLAGQRRADLDLLQPSSSMRFGDVVGDHLARSTTTSSVIGLTIVAAHPAADRVTSGTSTLSPGRRRPS
jgi:hypothetical protein